MELKKYFDYILNNYLLDENSKFSSDMDYYKVIVSYIPNEIIKYLNNNKYKVYGSCGKGAKSNSPFIAILDNNITTTTQKGIYVDFIFKSDMTGFYLTIDQGITGIKEKYGNKNAIEIAKKVAKYFRSELEVFKGFKEGLVSNNAKSGSLEADYNNTRVIAKYYEKDNYTNEELFDDFKKIMAIYEEIVNNMSEKSYDNIINEIVEETSWEKVYSEIALKVLEYKDNHQALIDLMYDILIELGLFNDNDEKNCNLDSYNGVRCRYDDFDPFSFMNRLDIYKNENRKNFIRLFQNKTGLKEKVPYNFDGIPSINPQNSCLIRFKNDERKKDVNDFWNLFEVAIKYSQNQTDELKELFIKYYDNCINKPGCSYNLTMGLFRIDPDFYINLDSTNRQFIKKEFNIDIIKCPNGEEYLLIIDNIKNRIIESNKYSSIVDFSKQAWISLNNSKEKQENPNKIWLYAPGENAMYWDECVKNSAIYIGWDDLGDLRQYSSDNEIYEAIKQKYNAENPKMSKCACSDFCNVMKPGDIIIPKKGLDKLLGYGIVTSDYIYDSTRERFKHTRKVEWKKIGEWINNTGTNNHIKTLTEISQYKEYAEQLLNIINGGDSMSKTEWIIPANPKYYDHESSFEKNGFIDWSQHANYNIGDIVYLYTTAPESRISAKTIVERINLTSEEKIDDSVFTLSDKLENKSNENKKYVRLKLLEKIIDNRLKYEELSKHGLWGRPMGAARVPLELSNYIHYVLDGTQYNENIKFDSMNIIYYGGPGCGKSQMVKQKYCNDENSYIRTTFYPDYTNSDFIGQLIPKYDKSREKLIYDIQAGPFTKALELAYKPENKNRNIYLIIEEINRGNAAAIFGDIFQLLDRTNSGESEYEISNYVIEEYLKEKIGIEFENKIKIPSNLSIIATMNTSDQNVYTLDSAFKRRWKMIYISNKFGISEESKMYDKELGNMNVPILNLNIKWADFVYKINKAIIEQNTFGINSEDKQLGKYFVGKSDLISSEVYETKSFEEASKLFAEKVLMYIWEDIAKLKPSDWFREDIKTFEKLVDNYQEVGIDIFSENIKNRLNDGYNESQSENV